MKRNRLYMICPTDNIEPVIRNRFDGHKCFYTSLGNSFCLDPETLEEIASIIVKADVTEITMVLSDDNCIIGDALNNQDYSKIRGLEEAYSELLMHREEMLATWLDADQYMMLLSYYLNKRIEELRSEMKNAIDPLPKINGLLYSKTKNNFQQIYSDLVCMGSVILN